MNQHLDNILQEALDTLSAGVPLDVVLSRYPDAEDYLRPLLKVATAIQAPDVHPQPLKQAESKRRFLEMAARSPVRRSAPGMMIRGLAGGLIVLALIITALLGSDVSLPGEPLYSVKRFIESARLALAPDSLSRARLQSDLQQERVNELSTLLERGQSVPVDFTGVWDASGPGVWSVGGLPVVLMDGIQLPDDLRPGMWVQVSGHVENHTLVISELSIVDTGPGRPPLMLTSTPSPTDTDNVGEDNDESTEPAPDEAEDNDNSGPGSDNTGQDDHDNDQGGPGGGDDDD